MSILLLSTNLYGICSFAVLLLPQFKLFYLLILRTKKTGCPKKGTFGMAGLGITLMMGAWPALNMQTKLCLWQDHSL